jgi:hypothetical protein
MRGAVCDLEAFNPLLSLVRGPLIDLHELTEVERFVRTVVLHDEVSLRIPRQRCHRFQVNPATDSTAKLPLIP